MPTAPSESGERAADITLAWIEEGVARTPHADECEAPEDAPTVAWIVVNE